MPLRQVRTSLPPAKCTQLTTKRAAGVRSLGRAISRSSLEPVISVAEAREKAASSLSFAQGRAYQPSWCTNRGREGCRELARLAGSVMTAVYEATSGVAVFELHLAELERSDTPPATAPSRTWTSMVRLRLEHKPSLRRFWRKDRHACLTDAPCPNTERAWEHALQIFLGLETSPRRC
ncbi:hypothetical protein BC628DRAFT_1316509 [Trametes gibbosa]|nr:hypothetical protein BC628DRAFT_1316509 [Trametes gibbosa]